VDAIVSADSAGTTVAITNRHPTAAASCQVKLEGVLLDGEFDAKILDGDTPDAFNDVANPDAVRPRGERVWAVDGFLEVPPHSIYMVNVPA
jgi:alpha-L-arabinofuranosidase